MSALEIFSTPNENDFEIIQVGISNFPSLTVANPGAGTYGNGEAITTVAHNLGFVPAFMVFLRLSTTTYDVPKIIMSGSGATAEWDIFQISADETNLYLLTGATVYAKGTTIGGSTYIAKYFILRDRTRS